METLVPLAERCLQRLRGLEFDLGEGALRNSASLGVVALERGESTDPGSNEPTRPSVWRGRRSGISR